MESFASSPCFNGIVAEQQRKGQSDSLQPGSWPLLGLTAVGKQGLAASFPGPSWLLWGHHLSHGRHTSGVLAPACAPSPSPHFHPRMLTHPTQEPAQARGAVAAEGKRCPASRAVTGESWCHALPAAPLLASAQPTGLQAHPVWGGRIWADVRTPAGELGHDRDFANGRA